MFHKPSRGPTRQVESTVSVFAVFVRQASPRAYQRAGGLQERHKDWFCFLGSRGGSTWVLLQYGGALRYQFSVVWKGTKENRNVYGIIGHQRLHPEMDAR